MTRLIFPPVAALLCAAGPVQPAEPAAALANHVRERAATLTEAGTFMDTGALLSPLVTAEPEDIEDEKILRFARETNPEPTDRWTTFVRRLDARLYQGYTLQGTMHCQHDWFFTVDDGGVPSLVETPPSYGLLCWSGGRSPATAFNQPTLIQTVDHEGPYYGSTVTITPWDGAGWQAPFQIDLRFDDSFAITEHFCVDATDCEDLEGEAKELARLYVRGGEADPVGRPDLQSAESAFGSYRSEHRPPFTTLPTFGDTTKTEWPDFSSSRDWALERDGEMVLVQAGIGGIGWRDLGDLMVVFARHAGDSFEPFASFVIRREQGQLRSVEVTTPEVCDDDSC